MSEVNNVKFNIDSSETEKISAPIDGSSMAEVEQLKQEIEELRGRNDELVNSLTTLEETMNRVGNSSGKAAGRVGNVGNQSGTLASRSHHLTTTSSILLASVHTCCQPSSAFYRDQPQSFVLAQVFSAGTS